MMSGWSGLKMRRYSAPGSAFPQRRLVWCVIEHGSAMVAYDVYQELLDKAATLVPWSCKVVFLADRGFADTELMSHLRQLGWHWRIRIKSNCWIDRCSHTALQVGDVWLAPGQARFWRHVWLTAKRFGPVHRAVARPLASDEYWYVISDEPTEVKTLEEYGLRFDIEENFLDDKSNGFQLESSLIRSPKALERLCCVLAMSTLYLVSQGTAVVQQGQRRFVDPHWFRGNSYLKIGWKWIIYALTRGDKLLATVYLSSEGDPEPAMASEKQGRQRQDRFVFEYQEAA